MAASLSDIAQSPDWLPHRIDLQAQRLELVRLTPDSLTRPGFLADYKPRLDADRATISLDELRALEIETSPLHFVFHTAFCRSTLLARALNIEGISVGMSEPGIFASLSGAGGAAQPYLAPIMALLARKRGDNAAVFVKPTNHSNSLIPQLLAACPSASAVLMTNGLEPFLQSVLRKGMMGRRWGRNLFLELQSYAPMDFGMDSRELFLATDMQVAGLAWFLNQMYFAGLASGPHKARLRVLDGDRFNLSREETIAALLELADVPATQAQLTSAATGKAFTTHAKLGGEFTAVDGMASERSISPVANEEIVQVSQWIGMIAEQTGLKVPLPQTLF